MRIIIVFPSKDGKTTAIPSILQYIAKDSNIPEKRRTYDGYCGEGLRKYLYCIRWKQEKDYGWEGLIDYKILKDYWDRVTKLEKEVKQ